MNDNPAPEASATTAPYPVRAFNPAHPNLKNGAGAPARIASEHHVEALARVVYIWGHPLVNTVGRTSTWALMEGKGPGMAMGLFPGSPKNHMGYLDDYMPSEQRKVVTPNNDNDLRCLLRRSRCRAGGGADARGRA